MEQQHGPGALRTNLYWWLCVALLGAAVAIDAYDGEPLKLGTSLLLFAGCLLNALVRPPRSRAVKAGTGALLLGAAGLMIYRLVGPGL
ncbi:hypothetical protein [Massilia glaciei]|nr:hypothetical protein [Massilia glaciei]